MTLLTDPYSSTELHSLPPHTLPPLHHSSTLQLPSLIPNYTLPAQITTVHPQLRDLLVCPHARGKLYYIKGKGVMELTVQLPDDGDAGMEGGQRRVGGVVPEWEPRRTYKPLSTLPFIPNCLTANTSLLACGGQNGELHLTTLPGRSLSSPSTSTLDDPGTNPGTIPTSWTLTTTLPRTSINNSFLLLPPYSGRTPLPTRPSSRAGTPHAEGGWEGGTATTATYPNSIRTGMRRGGAGGSTTSTSISTSTRGGDDGTYPSTRPYAYSGRARGYTDEDEEREDMDMRSGMGMGSDMHMHTAMDLNLDLDLDLESEDQLGTGRTDWEGYQTVFPPPSGHIRSGFSPGPHGWPRTGGHSTSTSTGAPANTSGLEFADIRYRPWRSTGGSSRSYPRAETVSTGPAPAPAPAPWHVIRNGVARSVSPTRMGPGGRYTTRDHAVEYEDTRCPVRQDEPRLLVSNNDMSVKLFAIRNAGLGGTSNLEHKYGPGRTNVQPGLRWGEVQDVRPGKKLAKIGGTTFDTAVNHASVSPDGRTMLVVGDTNDVFLYEIKSGGREFVKIARYEGSKDAGFSTSWSADGRKFVVASQDGQVTVWDHRSSHPLAKLYTNRLSARSTTYGLDASHWDQSQPGSPTPYVSPTTTAAGLPMIGARSVGTRDPARVVKFSPAGSDRELLVFSEETENIHIVDARTFETQISVRVPVKTLDGETVWSNDTPHIRTAFDRGRVGIAGLCFDETGDYLYAGTESSIVEYDLRLESKRGSGSIGLL